MRAFVIGSPIQQTLSPAIFYYLSKKMQRSLEYQKKEIRPDEVDAFLAELRRAQDVIGCNVTLPLKELISGKLDDLSDEARFLGAINVISSENGALKGYNTDVVGIQKTFERFRLDLKDKEVLVFGAGGSARALIYVLGKLKLKSVYIFNPRSPRGEDLVLEAHKKFPDTIFKNIKSLHEIHSTLGLVVNSTPVGMGGSDPTEIFKFLKDLAFEKNTLAFDFVYYPQETPFMDIANKLQLKVVNGLDMLIDQALATWAIWQKESVGPYHLHDDLKEYLNKILSLKNDKLPITIVGFMGAGKTVLAKTLSNLTGRELIDLDETLEKETGMSVADIFDKKGEAYFRELEKSALALAIKKPRTIIALGGGAILDSDSLKLVKDLSYSIYLEVNETKVYERLKDQISTRPLLRGSSPEVRISQLLNARKEAYEEANLKIDTSSLTPDEVLFKLLSEWDG